MMSNRNKVTLNPCLPEELIEEILLRLPVRFLLRLKCVCKSWLSLISDPNFAKSLYDLASAPTYRFVFITTSGSQVQSIDIEASLHDHDSPVLSTHVLPHPFYKHQFHDSFYNNILIYGSCRGFLLLNYRQRNLLVWNPSTGVHKPISYSHVKFTSKIMYGFGYDASTDDYLVLLMVMGQNPYNSPNWKQHIEIFSLKTNSWDQIEGIKFPKCRCLVKAEAGLLCNGALHWLVYLHDAIDHRWVIIAFDLIQRSLSEIPLPHKTGLGLGSGPFILRVMGDCLCLCNGGGPYFSEMSEIWMMKEYKVHSSWTKSFVLSTKDFFLPISFSQSEGFIGTNGHGELQKLNNKGVLIEHLTYGCDLRKENPRQHRTYGYNDFEEKLPEHRIYSVYRESLLSLPGHFGEAGEDDQQ